MVILLRFEDDEIISLLKGEFPLPRAPLLHEFEGDGGGAELVEGCGEADGAPINSTARPFDAEAPQILLVFLGRDGFDSYSFPGAEVHGKDFLTVAGIAAGEGGEGKQKAGAAGEHRNSMLKRNGVPEAVP